MEQYDEQEHRFKLLLSNLFVTNNYILCRKCLKCVPLDVIDSCVFPTCLWNVLCSEEQRRARFWLHYVDCTGIENRLADNFVSHFPQNTSFLANCPEQPLNSLSLSNICTNRPTVWRPAYRNECPNCELLHVAGFK